MCNIDSRLLPPHAPTVAYQALPSTPSEPQQTAQASRRRRIWELPTKCHCPLIGVCLDLREAQRLYRQMTGNAATSDFDAHVTLVSACGTRNEHSRAMDRLLDSRFRLDVLRYRSLRDEQALYAAWRADMAQARVAGALWATLTHRFCTDELEHRLYGDIHMLQHQTGASARVERRLLEQAHTDRQRISQALAAAQADAQARLRERDQRIDTLQRSLAQAQAQLATLTRQAAERSHPLAADSCRCGTEQADPDKDRLRDQVAQLTARLADSQARCGALEASLERAAQRIASLAATRQHDDAMQDPGPADSPPRPAPPSLQGCSVFCIGGRTGNVSRYRALIERMGGRFAHHDGGREESLARLEQGLAAADLVICQAGCISHQAYWRVKSFCRRQHKQCIFVDNPGLSTLVREIEQAVGVGVDSEHV